MYRCPTADKYVATEDSSPQQWHDQGDIAEQLAEFLYGGERRLSHERWRRVAVEQLDNPSRNDDSRAEASTAYRQLRALGACVDTRSLAGDACQVADLHEWLMPSAPSLAIVTGIHFNLFLGSLIDHGRHGRDLDAYLSLRRLGTFLVTELAHGNDVSALETMATYVPARAGFVIHTPNPGARKFMPNTSLIGGPKDCVVAARAIVDGKDEGVLMFLVPLAERKVYAPGVHVTHLPRRIGPDVDHCITRFNNVFVPRTALLGGVEGRMSEDGTFTSDIADPAARVLRSIGRVTPGKLAMSATGLGMARHALAIAIRYGGNRYIRGAEPGSRLPLMAFRSYHEELVGSVADIFALTSLHRDLQRRWDERAGADPDELEWLLAVAKAAITWRCREILIECRERCGAQGLYPANAIAGYLSSIELPITAEGDNMAVWVKAAARMVRNHPFPPLVQEATGGNMSDPGYLWHCMATVEQFWLARARRRRSLNAEASSIQRQNSTGVPARRALEVAARRLAAQSFSQRFSQLPSGAPARALLEDLYRLYMLRGLTRDCGDPLVAQHLACNVVGEIHDVVDELTARLASRIDTLVAAFDIPERVFADVPIVRKDFPDSFHTHL